jgi:surface antigen
MRTFLGNAPTTIGAGVALFLLLAPAPSSLEAGDQISTLAVVIEADGAKRPLALAEIKARLGGSDRSVAMNALDVALNELGDGATLVWKREARALAGVIRPIAAFRDDKGRICRHLIYSLSFGQYARQVEGIACRGSDGVWSLQG